MTLGKRIVAYRASYLFIAPFFILFLVFQLYPLIYGAALSFNDWHGVGRWKAVGLSNYQSLFKDDLFLKSLGNTVYLWIVTTIPLTVFSLVAGALLNAKTLRLRGIFRTIYILPYVTPTVIIAIVFSSLYDQSYGWINLALNAVGIKSVPWLASSLWSKPSITGLSLWKWLGYDMVIMLGGLQGIPEELYEAATIDGAGGVRKFFSITVPMMRLTIFFLLILSTIGSFNMFDEPYMLTKGGPENSSITLNLYLYNTVFSYGRFGYGACVAIAISVLIIVASFLQRRVMKDE